MLVLQVEGVYYDVHREDGRAWLVRFEDGEPVGAVAEFIDENSATQLEGYLSQVAEIVKELEEGPQDELTIH